MTQESETRTANPTITEILARFLEDQRRRLTPRTFSNYEHVVELLQHCLDGYGHQSLDRADASRFERLYNAEGAEHREFCEIFGPEHILQNLDEFLGYFMVRKVIAGKETLRAAGTVTKKLAAWLAENGYVAGRDAEDAAKRGGEAARDLPRAEELASRLRELAVGRGRGDEDDEREGHFRITRVENGRIWLEDGVGGDDVCSLKVPADVARRCQVGWTLSGILGRSGKGWRIVEAWNVYP